MRPSAALGLVLVCLTAACRPAAPSSPAPADLTALLEAQFDEAARAWNDGDLDRFMADYAADSLTSYVAGGRVVYGRATIRRLYAPQFAPGAVRDSLHFERFEVRPLGPGLALVTARFVLSRADSVTASGPFSLVMESRPDGWKILHDHSSNDPR